MDLTQIQQLLNQNNLSEAIVELDDVILREPDNADAFFMRGRAYWRLGLRAKATGDYLRASRIDPQSPAAIALEQARGIEDFFNPDLLNP